jgi:WXG100 family type VII secretion target
MAIRFYWNNPTGRALELNKITYRGDAMPSIKIKCNYDEAGQLVNIFKDQNSSVSAMTKKIQAAKDELSGGQWVGKGAKAFFAEMDQKVLPALNKLSQALEGGSQNISKASQAMQQAEDDSKNLFNIQITINI